jgi:LL-diaminopimelate aminotransferase
MKFASRIEKLPPYVFAGMARRLAELRASGVEIINFTMGDPDVPTPDYLLEAMYEASRRPENSRYPDYYGKPRLRQAIADWYGTRFGVTLDPTTEVLPLIGSKEGIANVALAFVDSDEVALVPDPAYPVYKFGTLMADGQVSYLPLLEESGWLPDLESIEPELARKVNVLWLNYPNNPTGAVADIECFERIIHWAKKYDVIVAHDNPYSEMAYDGFKPPSILEVPEARDIAVEFNSFSKTFSMAGHRIGMAVGNPEIIGVLGRIKTNIDSGVYGAIQDMATTALTSDLSWIAERNEIYRRRRDKLCVALRDMGIEAVPPQAGLYIWARVPEGYTSSSFTEMLLQKAGIAITPGTTYGKQGDGFFRLAFTVPDEQIDEAVARLAKLDLGANALEAIAK